MKINVLSYAVLANIPVNGLLFFIQEQKSTGWAVLFIRFQGVILKPAPVPGVAGFGHFSSSAAYIHPVPDQCNNDHGQEY